MRPLLLAFLTLAACAADPVLLPDAGACGGACGVGTHCEASRCVSDDGGALEDATTPDAPAADGPCLRPVWTDTDGDTYGAGVPQMAACDATTPGFATRAGDCDDANPAIHPGAVEMCDGVNSDCDAWTDNHPDQPNADHPLTLWCEMEAARHPEVAAQLAERANARCVYSAGEARCRGAGRTGFVCWRASGAVPCN